MQTREARKFYTQTHKHNMIIRPRGHNTVHRKYITQKMVPQVDLSEKQFLLKKKRLKMGKKMFQKDKVNRLLLVGPKI